MLEEYTHIIDAIIYVFLLNTPSTSSSPNVYCDKGIGIIVQENNEKSIASYSSNVTSQTCAG